MSYRLNTRPPTRRQERMPPKRSPFPDRGFIKSPDSFRSQRMPLSTPVSQTGGPASQSQIINSSLPGMRRIEVWAKLRFPSKVMARSLSEHSSSQYAFMRKLIAKVDEQTCQIQQTEQPNIERFRPTDKWCVPHCEFEVAYDPHFPASPRISSGKSEAPFLLTYIDQSDL